MRISPLLLLVLAGSARAVAPREDFPMLLETVKTAPTNDIVREKLLKAAAALKKSPAIPAEARRHLVKGVTLQKEAKNAAEYDGAVAEYRLALAAAPWWGDVYYNMAIAQESAGQFADAKKSLGFYILTKPKDAEAAQDRLYALEAKAEKAAGAAVKAAAEAEKYTWLLGRWDAEITVGGASFGSTPTTAAREGDTVTFTLGTGPDASARLRVTMKEGSLIWEFYAQEYPNRPGNCTVPFGWKPKDVVISADRRHISLSESGYETHSCNVSKTMYWDIHR